MQTRTGSQRATTATRYCPLAVSRGLEDARGWVFGGRKRSDSAVRVRAGSSRPPLAYCERARREIGGTCTSIADMPSAGRDMSRTNMQG
jgi:hypothetical protein